MKNIDSEIVKKEAEIKKLKQEKEYLESLPEDVRLAEILHSYKCGWNHTDGCGWYYSSWEKPCGIRNEYREKARRALKEFDFDTILQFINLGL